MTPPRICFPRLAGDFGQHPELGARYGEHPRPLSTFTILAPSSATEGDDPAISASNDDSGLSLTLVDVSPVVDVNIQTGVTTPYATTYPDITPGTRQVRFFNEANPSEFTSTASITVAPQAPVLSSPADEASFTVGDIVTFTADGTADGWDANTTKVEFYVNSVLRATANAPTAGAWTATWDTTGATPGTNLSVVAKRYWVGLAGETGTIDSTVATDIDIVAGSFSPADITGLVFWQDMQDTGAYTESGGVVTQFINKASSVAWTEATNRAAYSATGLNGLPCMDFDGTNDRYISTEAAVVSALTNAAAYTVIYVGSHDTVDRGDSVFAIGNSGVATSRTRRWGQSTDGAGRWQTQSINDAGTTVTNISAGGSNTSPHIFYWHSPGTTVSLQVDNAAASPSGAASDPGTLTPDRCAVGSRPDSAPDTFFDGKLGELIVYAGDITGTDYTDLLTYLQTKWGL